MKNILIIIAIGFMPTYLYAQAHDTAMLINSHMLMEIHGKDTIYAPMPVSDGDTVNDNRFTFIEHMPVPPVDVKQYLATHIVYPEDALKAHKQGKVVVKFYVTKTGKIAAATIVKNCYPSLDTEALRLIGNMPDWTPGRNGGQPVDVYFALPVIFKLPK